ncbi:MAG: hypothetical protein H0U74_11375 [Bradymonadaceae bacterium]|nr:hypothetical protein [Lujinxingiaceae bacterium]
MNLHRFHLFLAMLICALVVSACGRDEVSRTCQLDSECADGTCVAGTCVSVIEDVGSDTDTETDTEVPLACTSNEQCGVQECVVQGNACVSPACDLGQCKTIDCVFACSPGFGQVGCECVASSCESSLECAGLVCVAGVCEPCASNAQCSSDGTLVCDNGFCDTAPECTVDSECPPHLQCSSDKVCVDRRQCTFDRDCGADQKCIGGQCAFSPQCTVDEDTCGPFAECIGGSCHVLLCRGPNDCAEGELCDAGRCVPPPATKHCTIATRGGTIAPNQRVRLEAFAYDQDGNGVAANFAWRSSQASVAAIEGSSLVGGTTAGETTVTASLSSGEPVQCEGSIKFTNVGLVQPGSLRVLVSHAENQTPVANARVIVNGGQAVGTDANGLAILALPQGPFEVSVFADAFNYITIQGVSAHDVRIPLNPRAGTGPVAGLTGQFDTSRITSSGDVTIGLAGASLAGGSLDIDLTRLLGEPFVGSVQIPGQSATSFPLPGGVIAYGAVFGFQFDVKRNYFVNSSDGARVGWGLAGKVPLNQLIPLFTGGGGSMAEVLTSILPLFSRFEHAARPLNLVERPRIVDSADINGNGDRTEMVPDYNNFPKVNFVPSVRQTLATEVAISNFPILNGVQADVAVLVGGALLDAPGFIPLGISATADENEDGRPDARLLYMAPPHGSATGGRFSIMALAFDGNNNGGGGAAGLSTEFSVSMWNGQSLPTSISFGTFPDSSEGEIDAASRKVSFSANAGPLYRVRLIGEERTWDVWSMGAPGTMGEFQHALSVPATAPGTADLFINSTIMLDAIRSAVTLDDLVRGTGVGLRNAGLVTTSYNRTRLR